MNDTANSKYIWDAGYNYPISIHIYGGDYSQSFLQSLSNRESLTVRDYRKGAEKVDYFPECGEPLVDNPSCWNEFDGQPDEAQEWHDFDPDC